MDKEKIKKAIDHFQNDEYTDAKEIISKEIETKKNEYLKDKLGLKTDLNDTKTNKEEDGDKEDE